MSAIDTRSQMKFSNFSQRLARPVNWFIDLVFPPTCEACGRVDYRFCETCLAMLEHETIAVRHESLSHALTVTATGKHVGLLAHAIRAFKYSGAIELAIPLSDRLIAAFGQQHWPIDVVIPVPLSQERLAERGYNQSNVICKRLSEAYGIPRRVDSLKRIRHTDQQARLQGEQRQANVRDAFAASADVAGLSILLVDDVVTTGSTLRECAFALQAKGAKAVYALAVSHS